MGKTNVKASGSSYHKKDATAHAREIRNKAIDRARGGVVPTYRGFPSLQAVMRGRGIKGETKAVDILPASYNLTAAAASVTTLNLVVAGSTFNQRIGRKICLKSLYIRGHYTYTATPSTAASDPAYVRTVVVYDKQTNGAAPTWANVFTSYDQALTTSSTALDHVNLDFRDRFVILADETHLIMPFGAAQQPAAFTPTASEMMINRYIPLKNMETQYKADSSPSVVGDIATGGLFLLQFSSATPANGTARFTGSLRLRFTDN